MDQVKEVLGRKRLAKLWGVAPYRIDLEIYPEGFLIAIDGQSLSPEQIALFEKEVQATTSSWMKGLN